MTLVVSLEFRFTQTPDGQIWTRTSYPYAFWERYLKIFQNVRVVARAERVTHVGADYKTVTGHGVEFIAVPFYIGPRQYWRVRRQVRDALRAAVGPADAVLCRVSSRLADELLPDFWKRNRPYGLEVVGDPMECLARGAVKHPLRPVFQHMASHALRKECARASAISYVTESALQQRYPASRGGLSISASDVDLNVGSFKMSPRVFTTYYSSADLSPEAFASQPKMHTGSVPPNVVFVGSLAQMYKGADILLAAVSILKREGLAVELSIVGDGMYRGELEDLARSLGLASSVVFRGELPGGAAVREQLDWASLFVLPSRTEGLPRVLVEAMARALPCVATNVGGIPELLHPDDLVSSNDAVALAARLGQVLKSPQRLNEMSARNLAKAQEFRPEVLETRRSNFYKFLHDVTEEWLAVKTKATA